MKTEPSTTRLRALDSLRGLAALVVVFAHCYQIVPDALHPASPYLAIPLSVLAAGGQFAVIVFFVLSGFVLSLPYWNGNNQPYALYIVRRFCRLYLPYAFAVAAAAIFCLPFTDAAARIGWNWPVSSAIVGQHLLMTGVGPESTMLDTPIWSLIIEMRISLIFPLLFLAVRRFGIFAVAAGMIGAFVCCKLNARYGAAGEMGSHFGQDALGAWLLTGRYIPAFLFGIIAACYLEPARRILASLPKVLHIVLCTGIVVLHAVMARRDLQYHGYGDIAYGIAAVYLVYLAASCGPFPARARKLMGPPLLWLGDTSYSLYLIHVPVLYVILNVLQGYAGYGFSLAIAVPAIFLAAHLMHALVEMPSQRLGRKLAGRLGSKQGLYAQVTLPDLPSLPPEPEASTQITSAIS